MCLCPHRHSCSSRLSLQSVPLRVVHWFWYLDLIFYVSVMWCGSMISKCLNLDSFLSQLLLLEVLSLPDMVTISQVKLPICFDPHIMFYVVASMTKFSWVISWRIPTWATIQSEDRYVIYFALSWKSYDKGNFQIRNYTPMIVHVLTDKCFYFPFYFVSMAMPIIF